MSEFSLIDAYRQIKNGDVERFRKDFMKTLGIKGRTTFFRRINGEVEPKVTEAERIEEVFKKYGVANIWKNRDELKSKTDKTRK